MLNQVFNEDCLEGMKRIPDKSVDMILCDLPYGTTACKWDTIIPFEPLWEQYKRVLKNGGAIVLFGSQPFTSALIMSNPKWFKYEWIWSKNMPTGFAAAKYRPMSSHENILVFGKGKTTYNRIFERSRSEQVIKNALNGKKRTFGKSDTDQSLGLKKNGSVSDFKEYVNPKTVQSFDCVPRSKGSLHPTQKPVPLFEYLIKTYTNEGETVLDNCMGSGTTAIACLNTGRNYIGFELERDYYEKLTERIAAHKLKETEVVD